MSTPPRVSGISIPSLCFRAAEVLLLEEAGDAVKVEVTLFERSGHHLNLRVRDAWLAEHGEEAARDLVRRLAARLDLAEPQERSMGDKTRVFDAEQMGDALWVVVEVWLERA